MLFQRIFPVGLILSLALNTAFSQRTSGIPEIDSLPLDDWHIATPPLSYTKALFYSALIPGGGQIYGRHYVRAGFLIGLEGGLSSDFVFFKQDILDAKTIEARNYLDSAQIIFEQLKTDPLNDSLVTLRNNHINSARRRIDLNMKQWDLRKSEMAWTLGLHFYGMADAVEMVHRSRGINRERLSTSRALLSGLLPGGGQIYNRKFGKFGMLWMALGSSAASIYFRQQMVDYFQNRLETARAEADGLTETLLEREVTTYRKSRNQYYWGIALLYLYSIGDAVVDAALNDFDASEKYALTPGNEPLSFNLSVSF